MTKRKTARIVAAATGIAFLAAFGYPLVSAISVGGLQSVSRADLVDRSGLVETRLGDPSAPVEVIKYTSLTCRFCASFHNDNFHRLKEEYIDTGLVTYVVRDTGFDVAATAAAMFARCEPDRYFDITEVLYERHAQWTNGDIAANLRAIARQVGFGTEKFESCLSDESLLVGINRTREQAGMLGVTGTPAFFINGERHVGSMNYPALSRLIEAAISRQR